MQFAEMVDFYGLPARDREQPRPVVTTPGTLRWLPRRVRGAVRRRHRGRRLAYLDNTFPWTRSGFRYHEALAIHELRPDTLFFSMWQLTDPFPVPVHPIARFPEIAAEAGITDAYGVFQLFLEGIAGSLVGIPEERDHAFAGPDMSQVLDELRIRLHGSIYPGGGFVPSPEGYERLRALTARMHTTITVVPDVAEHVPGVVGIDPAFTNTDFYARSDERWAKPKPLTCLFAADKPPRKGIDVVLEAFSQLDPDAFQLHVVGPHLDRRGELPSDLATFHGWLAPEDLRDLHRRAHVVLSPVRAETIGPAGSYHGVTDGFPTQAAADAVSSGCLLISANPGNDHRVLEPGAHYIDRAPEPTRWRAALRDVAVDMDAARRLADAGCRRLRNRMEIRNGTARKLELIGLLDGRGARTRVRG